MDINLLDWFGYLASLIILISLVSTSIIKLRLINTVGATLFATYGILIGSLPTAGMNAGIVLINIYYLVKIYKSKEDYEILEFPMDSSLFKAFVSYYKDDIQNTFKQTEFDNSEENFSFYVLRDMVPASIFIATPQNDHTLEINLDFATPAYRDFKIGSYLYEKHSEFFTDRGYHTLTAKAHVLHHEKYLLKMGFVKDGEYFTKKFK